MIVIRMETVGNRNEGRDWDCAYEYSCHWSALPSPQMEHPMHFSMNGLVCGCTSIKQFHIWWLKKHMKRIPLGTRKKQARIVILDVPDIVVTVFKKQCTFPRSKAKIVGTMNAEGIISWKNIPLKHSSTTEKEEFSQSGKTRTSKPTRFKPITLTS